MINNSCTSQDKLDDMAIRNPVKSQWFTTKAYFLLTAWFQLAGGGGHCVHHHHWGLRLKEQPPSLEGKRDPGGS